MRPVQAARLAKRTLAGLARPSGTFDASRYFRDSGGLGFYNVGTDRVRALAREVVRDNPAWTVDDACAFASLLVADRYLEVKGIGIEALGRYRRQFTPALLPRWKRWLANNQSANWATTDAICGTLIGPLLVDYPELVPLMPRWATHRNSWVRRASAVSLIPSIRKGRALDVAYDVAQTLQPDRGDLIQKASGWMLREAGKQDPARLERYLRAEGDAVPRTTLRYAIERFPAPKRRALLTSTRHGRDARARARQPERSWV
jgi:3-methyladenine DNA glycosylase AlkD